LRTDWFAPNPEYERACRGFLDRVLTADSEYVHALAQFVESIAPAGVINGLSQTALRLTCPGIADLYQGTELWDYSLVDPDNRRPVDYARRRKALSDEPPSAHLAQWREGTIKLALIRRALSLRARRPDLFIGADYVPLDIEGPMSDHVIAFGRLDRLHKNAAIVIATRLPGAVLGSATLPLVTASDWGDTCVSVPDDFRHAVFNLNTDREVPIMTRCYLRDALAQFPVALMTNPG
jgi:(1->4)-alpha-D-glucan 1-alpha-D-glucosylmutase